MVQTLIANSGIQFFSREILLDANDGFRQVFYEWFDEEQVEQVLETVRHKVHNMTAGRPLNRY